MVRRALGFLLIVKALSPFLWLLAAYLVVVAIVDRFDRVSVAYGGDMDLQLAAYTALGERIGEQVEAVAPSIQLAAQVMTAQWEALHAELDRTIAMIEALPEIDLTAIIPELTFPDLFPFRISFNFPIPDLPLIGELVTQLRNGLQGVADVMNQAFASLTASIRAAFNTALAPLKYQLVANFMAQLAPYLDAHARLRALIANAQAFYGNLQAWRGYIEGQFAAAGDAWAAIGDDFDAQLEISMRSAEMAPVALGSAMSDAAWLLLLFLVVTVALFLVFYWATLLRDLRMGWRLLRGEAA